MKKQEVGSRKQEAGLLWRVWLAVALMCAALPAQQIQMGSGAAPRGKDHVHLVSDAVELKAGHEQVVELRFRVDEGYHINSHTPKDELLIPTVLKLDSGGRKGVDVRSEEYPAGSSFRLQIGDGETLDVYQGEFRVRVRMIADPGSSTLTGALHYQACDNAACFPPRTLPVQVAVNAK
jgi:hypothetical protein